jgi:sulfopropanediol 3-dehydrogenase
VTREAWDRLGSVLFADDPTEAIAISDDFAPEHLELQVTDPAFYHDRLRNYGSLFIGEETTVTFGDKATGPNHTLPTQGAARYTGGLWVGKFLKTCTYQEITAEASVKVGEYCSRLCAIERFWGHKEQADLRLRRYGGQDVGLGAKKETTPAK